MTDNDTDYSQSNRGNGLLEDLALINLGRLGVSHELNQAQRQKKKIASENEQLQSEVKDQQKKANTALKQATSLEGEVDDLAETVRYLHEEIHRLNELLSQPFSEIAKQHPTFNENYEKQMLKLAEWMVSQKASKEVAIRFGMEQGLSSDEVIDIINLKKLDVLDNKHNNEHGTNANDVTTITNRYLPLKNKILEQTKSLDKSQILNRIIDVQQKFHSHSTTNKFSI